MNHPVPENGDFDDRPWIPFPHDPDAIFCPCMVCDDERSVFARKVDAVHG